MKAERKSEVEPNGIAYHLIREAMTAVHGITSSWHGPRLATRPSNSVNVTVPCKLIEHAQDLDYAEAERKQKKGQTA
jgi:hypothetical protein